MNRSFSKRIAQVCVAAVLCAVHAQAQTNEAGQDAAPVVAGPDMWRVSHGENTLWIFGILAPLARGVHWQSEAVETVIAQAQEYIYFKTPEVELPRNPLKLINGLRLVLKLRNNPEGKKLEEVVPPQLYSRFAVLLAKYPFDAEKVRPYYAADGIRGMAVIHSALTEDHGVDVRIDDLVAQHSSIKATAIPLGLESVDYEFLKESAEKLFSGASLAAEIHCLEISVTSIENDISALQASAKAWEHGDMKTLRANQNYQKALDACSDVFLNTGEMGDRLEDSYQHWLNAVELALDNNSTTFAVLSMDQLVKPDGLLERLRSKGYSIVEP